MNKAWLNAVGIVCALGSGRDAVRARLVAGDASGMVMREGWVPGRAVCVGEVRDPLPECPPELRAYRSRTVRLLLAALAQIRGDVDVALAHYGPDRVGIVLGSSSSGIEEGGRAVAARVRAGRFPPGYDYRCQETGAPCEFLRRLLGVTGPAWTVSTACTAGAKAFASARRLLHVGLCDAVIVGGADSLSHLTINGFCAIESVARGRCQPFSANRDGINLGEGAALFLMTRAPGPVALLGAGESSDAYHISAPHPEGLGAEMAMRAALADAGIEAGAVDYVNLHGTATVQNDLVESHAVGRVLGRDVACSSTKSLVGHTLGVAGAIEAAFCWLLLAEPDATPLPPNVFDGVLDPALAPLHLVGRGESAACRVALSNSFAFGGSNATLVFGRG